MITCCLCNKEVDELYGHNPWPLTDNFKDRCCEECNTNKVIPARVSKSSREAVGNYDLNKINSSRSNCSTKYKVIAKSLSGNKIFEEIYKSSELAKNRKKELLSLTSAKEFTKISIRRIKEKKQ